LESHPFASPAEKSAGIRRNPPETAFPFLVSQLSKSVPVSLLRRNAMERPKVVTVCNIDTVSKAFGFCRTWKQ
jgi:hypothetical protein